MLLEVLFSYNEILAIWTSVLLYFDDTEVHMANSSL